MGNIQEELSSIGGRSISRKSLTDAYLNAVRTDEDGKGVVTKAAREWGKQTAKALRGQIASLGLREKVLLAKEITRIRIAKGGKVLKEPPLERSVGSRVRQQAGLPYRVDFPFVRHGIFLEHGVGKNRGKGSGKERPRPWLKPILEPAIEELAEALAEAGADAVLAQIKFVIPGIINKRATIRNNG